MIKARCDISILNSRSLKLVDKFTNQGSSVSSTETNVNTWLEKAWIAIGPMEVRPDIKYNNFFQAAVILLQLYGCTKWTLTKHMEKKLDGNYTSMLRAMLNKSWRQHPTKQQRRSCLQWVEASPGLKSKGQIHCLMSEAASQGGEYWSSSLCLAPSTDIPDPLSPLLLVHRLWQVFRATSHILTERLYVCSSWPSCFCSAMCGGSIGLYPFWARLCFSSSVLHVWFV